MRDRQGFDMKEYIEKRMLEIKNLEDRRLFKSVVGELILELHEYNKNAYDVLEQKILNECHSSQSRYSVYLSLTDKQHYDATDLFLQPMRLSDTKQRQLSYDDLDKAMCQKEPLKLTSIFFKGSVSQIYELLSQKERRFQGVIKTPKREYEATFALRENQEYMNMIEELYYIFGANYQPWSTVCVTYLKKMLDVYLCTCEERKEKEAILEWSIDFEEYSDQIKHDMIPLWNLQLLTEKTSTYPSPSIDRINYEHQIFSQRLKEECEYLICNTDMEITNIRRLKGDLFITCPIDDPCEWRLYQVNHRTGNEHYLYPVLSNQYKESFSGSIAEMFRKSIKTKGEMARLIESFDYGSHIQFVDFTISDRAPVQCMGGNYNMDGFIQDEIRVGSVREVLLIDFSVSDPDNYLNEDFMSFLVTQVQKVFPEYHCVGRLV